MRLSKKRSCYNLRKHTFAKFALSVGVLGTSAILPLQNLAHADEVAKEKEVSINEYALDKNLTYNSSTLVTYSDNGAVESTEVTESASTSDGQVIVSDTKEIPTIPLSPETVPENPYSAKLPKDLGPNYAVINPGGIQYRQIDKFNGNNAKYASVGNWISAFAGAVIPLKIGKNIWSQSAGTATAQSFLPTFKTKYYTTWVYQDSDSQAYYGKAITKEYTSSKRSTVKRTMTHITRLQKNFNP